MEDCCSNEKCCNPRNKQEECCDSEDTCHEDFTECLLEAADCAWMEVLKDKMKEYILSTQNERMTELAKIVAEGNNQCWKHDMEKKQAVSNLEENLCRFFGQSKK